MTKSVASEGKILKYNGNELRYAYSVNAPTEYAEMWVEVDEAEYLNWQAEQERLADMPQE